MRSAKGEAMLGLCGDPAVTSAQGLFNKNMTQRSSHGWRTCIHAAAWNLSNIFNNRL